MDYNCSLTICVDGLQTCLQMAGNMNLAPKAKDFIATAPFAPVLQSCSSAAKVAANATFTSSSSIGGGANVVNVEDISTLVRIAAQIIELGNRL